MMKSIAAFALTALLLLPAPNAARAGEDADYVVILHGIARTSASMEKLARHLSSNGYHTVNIDYASTEHDFAELTAQIHLLVGGNVPLGAKTHFVGYSMGTQLTRMYIAEHRPKNLGRVVMIAPPNRGSEVADFLKDNPLYRELWGPAGQQLTTEENGGIAAELPKPDYELGVIAGDRSIDPISSAVIPGKDDGKVAIERTKLDGMDDHIVVHASHTFIMQDDEAIRQTLHFLQNGVFDHDSEQPEPEHGPFND